MQTAICLLLVVFFLLMNAFFVIAEFALVRVRKSQIDMAVAEKRRGAEAARDVTTHINAYLSACQLGITLASLAIGWLGEPAVSAVLEAPLLSWGFPEATVYPICVAVGFFIVTTLHVVVGELIPKSFAIFATEKYALHTAGPLRVFYRITYPIMVIFNGITNGVMRLFGHDPADEHEVYTGEEIKLLIDESTESGLIDPEQNEFVDNIFDLGDKDAEGIMTQMYTAGSLVDLFYHTVTEFWMYNGIPKLILHNLVLLLLCSLQTPVSIPDRHGFVVDPVLQCFIVIVIHQCFPGFVIRRRRSAYK